jgi:hypothetical protein
MGLLPEKTRVLRKVLMVVEVDEGAGRDSDRDTGGDAGSVPGGDGSMVYLLGAGTPCVRGWRDAEHAARVLRGELRAWGIEGRVCVRASATAAGAGVVELGWVTPEVARLLAALLAQARNEAGGSASPVQVRGTAADAA